MVLKCGFCSDWCLDHKFRHMTAGMHAKHSEKMLEGWRAFVDDERVTSLDALFISGNLFATPWPGNRVMYDVQQGLRDVVSGGTRVFLLPGPKDTPLFTSKDVHAMLILASMDGVELLSPGTSNSSAASNAGATKTGNVIRDPLYSGSIAGQNVEIFAPPSPLPQFSDFELDIRTDPSRLSLFITHGRLELPRSDGNPEIRDRRCLLHLEHLESLSKAGLDHVIIGGQGAIPPGFSSGVTGTVKVGSVLHAPPVNPVEFIHAGGETGMSTITFDGNVATVNSTVNFCHYILVREMFDVTGLDADSINKRVLDQLEQLSTGKSLMQFTLAGTMDQDAHVGLSVNEFLKEGKKKNFYFELIDAIEYPSTSGAITTLAPMGVVSEIVDAESGQADDPAEKHLYSLALARIKRDWEALD
ncbi:MAG: hypothetical protein ACTSUE_00755 [Promethearchaeota archaeon]